MHTQACSTLCESMECWPSGPSAHGILQARILGWVAISFSKGSSQHRDQTLVFYIGGWILYAVSTYTATRSVLVSHLSSTCQPVDQHLSAS